MMQIDLLSYVVPVEQTVPILPSFKVGDWVRVVNVQTLPQALVGQVGIVATMLTPDIAQIEIEGQTWGMGATQLELIPAPQPASPSGLDLWHEAVANHRDRIVAKLASCPNASLYRSVIENLGGSL